MRSPERQATSPGYEKIDRQIMGPLAGLFQRRLGNIYPDNVTAGEHPLSHIPHQFAITTTYIQNLLSLFQVGKFYGLSSEGILTTAGQIEKEIDERLVYV